MAQFRDIRKRIGAVAKTQKITSAMKMVAAARLSRAVHAIESARPYAAKLEQVLAAVAAGVDPDAHPLLAPRESVRRLDVVAFTSDRGLCGAYNANVIRLAERTVRARAPGLESVSLIGVGKKGADYFRRRSLAELPRAWSGLGAVRPESAAEIAAYLMERYRSGAADEVLLVYSEFHSAVAQRPGVAPLLPLRAGAEDGATYEVEPDPVSLLRLLVPRAVEFAVFRALLENQAGEHGARMTAMENATRNTEELIRSLTLSMNKARQAAITAELIEIVSGAEAL